MFLGINSAWVHFSTDFLIFVGVCTCRPEGMGRKERGRSRGEKEKKERKGSEKLLS